MGLTTMVALWMVIQQPSGQNANNRPEAIAYYFDQSDCALVAAGNPRWKCVPRDNLDEARKRLDAALKDQ